MQDLKKILFWLEQYQSNWWVFQIKKIILFIPEICFQILLIFLLLRLLFLLLNRSKKYVIKNFLIVMIIFFISSFLWYSQKNILDKKCAFVVKDATFVYAGPEQTFHKIAELKSQTPVEILKIEDGMSQILSCRCFGWVQSNHLEIV